MDGPHTNAQQDSEYDIEKQEPVLLRPLRPDGDGGAHSSASQDQEQTTPTADGLPPVEDLDPAAERLARDLRPLSKEEFYILVGLRAPTPQEGGEYNVGV